MGAGQAGGAAVAPCSGPEGHRGGRGGGSDGGVARAQRRGGAGEDAGLARSGQRKLGLLQKGPFRLHRSFSARATTALRELSEFVPLLHAEVGRLLPTGEPAPPCA